MPSLDRNLSPPKSGASQPKPARVVACLGGFHNFYGNERATFEALRCLIEGGAQCHCILSSWGHAAISPRVEELGMAWSTGYYYHRFDRRARNPIKLAQYLLDIARTSRGLYRDARRFKPTHILIPEFMSVLRNAPTLGHLRARGVKVVLGVANAPLSDSAFHRRLWRSFVEPLVDLFICNSNFTRGEALKCGIPERKARTIYYCIPRRPGAADAPPQAERDPKRVIFVGQVIREKGIGPLIEAMGLLAQRGRKATLDVVGDIEAWLPEDMARERDVLLARVRAAGLADRVRFLGEREDVPALMAAAGVHCCPSLPEQREAFGIVNIEAKQARCPSVVTHYGGPPELIRHKVDGWICPDATPESLAEGLDYFLSDPARRDAAGEEALRSMDRFGRERYAREWREAFLAAEQGEPG